VTRFARPAVALICVWYLLALLGAWTANDDMISSFFRGQGGGILSLLNQFSDSALSRTGASGVDSWFGAAAALVTVLLLAALVARRSQVTVFVLAAVVTVLTAARAIEAFASDQRVEWGMVSAGCVLALVLLAMTAAPWREPS
jgi:hypothetical protein